tara:strand:- start:1759 stop:1914 length:156 start_codon:yes stop_codon:yes gene_type:complete
MKYNRDNVIDISDFKDIMKDYLRDWVKKETEYNVKVWFDDEIKYKEKFDEG